MSWASYVFTRLCLVAALYCTCFAGIGCKLESLDPWNLTPHATDNNRMDCVGGSRHVFIVLLLVRMYRPDDEDALWTELQNDTLAEMRSMYLTKGCVRFHGSSDSSFHWIPVKRLPTMKDSTSSVLVVLVMGLILHLTKCRWWCFTLV